MVNNHKQNSSNSDSSRSTDRSVSRRRFLGHVGAVTGLASVGFAGVSAADSLTALEAEVTAVEKETTTNCYPTYDTDGNRVGEAAWRTVKGTGNCCENYLAATPDGRLLDMGGNYLYYSDDHGENWMRVEPSTPYPITSEGCVSAAPNGDIVAVDWNPYSGDRVIAYKYVADDDQWLYNEVPLHTPFYDRPWFTALKGPFTVGGVETPYVTVMTGGWPSDDVMYVSLDGLTYELASNEFLDSLTQNDVEQYLDIPADPEIDWLQPNTLSGFTPLSNAKALADETVFSFRAGFLEEGCDRVILDGDDVSDVKWSCFDTLAGLPQGRLLADSQGSLHQIQFETESTFVYRHSTDGGRNWTMHRQPLPDGFRLDNGNLFDFKANGALDTTALVVHATNDEQEVDQDILYKFEHVTASKPTSTSVKYVGIGDESYVVGVSNEERFDFQTLGILPDGSVAVSFADSEDSDPRIAIERGDGARGDC